MAVANFGDGSEILFVQDGNNINLSIQVCYPLLNDGLHGFHIHESGDTRNSCQNMRSHYNPEKRNHGPMHGVHRHKGDLGNLTSREGCISESRTIQNEQLENIIGRGVVIHENEDDLGKGTGDSARTGNAGARLLCAPIVRS